MFENISNMNQFINNKKMDRLWNLKKGGLLLPTPKLVTASSNKEKTLSSISNKLTSGKRLTPEEMRYLQEHAPDMHRQAVQADAERSSYESAAKSCRTKSDVQNLHSRAMSGIMASAKADPVGTQIKAAAITDAHATFIKSNAYSKLPTEADEKQDKDGNSSKRKKDKTNTANERQELMHEITDAEQNIQFTLKNYNAQAEKRANAEASSKSEPVTIQTSEEEMAAMSRLQSSAESTRAYLQIKGITIDNPLENHVSFSSLVNNSSSAGSTNDIIPAPVGSAFVGRAHAAYATARSTVTNTSEPTTTTNTAKSGLRAKA